MKAQINACSPDEIRDLRRSPDRIADKSGTPRTDKPGLHPYHGFQCGLRWPLWRIAAGDAMAAHYTPLP
jgi:hypothetical protein